MFISIYNNDSINNENGESMAAPLFFISILHVTKEGVQKNCRIRGSRGHFRQIYFNYSFQKNKMGRPWLPQPLQLGRLCPRKRSLRRAVGSRATDSKDNSPGGTTGTPTPHRIVKLVKQ